MGYIDAASAKLSEEFIREHPDDLDWNIVSRYQDLSEDLIRQFKDRVNWTRVCIYQKLSEGFIREFSDRVHWQSISIYQILSEEFIREFLDKLSYDIFKYQKLSDEFIKENRIVIPNDCWLYKTTKWKEEYIRRNTDYEIIDGMVIAYKTCRRDWYSKYSFRYLYEVGKEYESSADHNPYFENSFGLSAWTTTMALDYCDEKLLKVGVKIEDVACIVRNGRKIRATKIKVLEEIPLTSTYRDLFEPGIVYPMDSVGEYVRLIGKIISAGSGQLRKDSSLFEEPIHVEVETEYGIKTAFTNMQARVGMWAVIRVYSCGGGFYPDNTLDSIATSLDALPVV